MNGEFAILKKQLVELAKVINSFKSEAVQLKVTELVLTGQVTPASIERPGVGESGRRSSQSRKKRIKKKSKKAKSASKRRTSKTGAAAILTELINKGYFKKSHIIGDIIKHAANRMARQLKATELSGPLARFVRDSRLSREKNKDGQYEYKQP